MVLDVSKLFMFDFRYNVIAKRYGKNTLKSVQVRRAQTLQALNWASKFHVSRAKVGL
jgi:hypothetical protein